MTPRLASLAAELRETTDAMTARARAAGHDPHPFALASVTELRTACRQCGARFRVTVTAEAIATEAPPEPCPMAR